MTAKRFYDWQTDDVMRMINALEKADIIGSGQWAMIRLLGGTVDMLRLEAAGTDCCKMHQILFIALLTKVP